MSDEIKIWDQSIWSTLVSNKEPIWVQQSHVLALKFQIATYLNKICFSFFFLEYEPKGSLPSHNKYHIDNTEIYTMQMHYFCYISFSTSMFIHTSYIGFMLILFITVIILIIEHHFLYLMGPPFPTIMIRAPAWHKTTHLHKFRTCHLLFSFPSFSIKTFNWRYLYGSALNIG